MKSLKTKNNSNLEIIFVGRSNVGKSSLIRCLTGRSVPTGRKPGLTRKPLNLELDDLTITDMPGFGFISGVEEKYINAVKDEIVHYIEENADRIILGFVVVDAKSFLDIVNRWLNQGEIPVDLEMYDFLSDLAIDTKLLVNKIDKIRENRDELLDAVGERFNMLPPWQQWLDTILPVSAKKKEIQPLQHVIRQKLVDIKKERLLKYFSTKCFR
ncbi:MAG: GTP-binding protein EngB [Candidatus Argoarchaeum ethanivorans]|uniref:Probable GTP-binding protein EngB n=1 Tax=Candidatus Argoarchaeum ethanivorans TaxID=2608793 RepID=A0A811TIT1_9EURY|nr:MAG: GTP-binding protein EngB [Candidatus Argoarchaeum ethanivorans]